jgi:uncharacterized protein (DUF4213/DUF364 family)
MLGRMNILDPLIDAASGSEQGRTARTLDVRVGPFWTAVQTTVGTGIASTLAGEARPHEGLPVGDAGKLLSRTPQQLAAMARSPSAPEAAIGLAAVNALIGRPSGRVTGDKALTLLKKRCQGTTTAMIGRFPFAEDLRAACRTLWVFERNHRLGPGVVSAEEAPRLLPQAEVVAITATTLINGTLEALLEHVDPAAWVMMLGPSTPMTSYLFERGFDVLCGTYVPDPGPVVAAVSQGATTKQITGVERLSLWRDEDD